MAQHVSSSAVQDQLVASTVEVLNQARHASEAALLAAQEQAMQQALDEMQAVREAIGEPGSILGSDKTKHGEIAEFVEVGVRRARDALAGRDFSATFDGVGRTAPMDYRIDGVDVQSKFINGANGSLEHVLRHMKEYANFGRDGSYYHIPRDLHEIIERVRAGDAAGLNEKSVRTILAKVQEIEQLTGQPFETVVRPGISTYDEVQQGRVSETLERHQEELETENRRTKQQIHADHQPGWAEGLKATATGAAIGAGISLVQAIYRKYRQDGRNPFRGQYTAQDWKELGIQSGKGAAIGGISAAAIYTLTNWASMSAPLAGSVVTAVKGLTPLVRAYAAGKISLDALLDEGTLVCADAAVVLTCTLAGQALIPVPVLGGLIGAMAGKVLGQALAKAVPAAAAALAQRAAQFMQRLDASSRALMQAIDRKFDALGDLARAAFDIGNNARLVELSIAFARQLQVPEAQILKSHDDLMDFMNS